MKWSTLWDCRLVVFYGLKLGLIYDQSQKRLDIAFDDNVSSSFIISYWLNEFKSGRCTLQVDERSGRPAQAVC